MLLHTSHPGPWMFKGLIQTKQHRILTKEPMTTLKKRLFSGIFVAADLECITIRLDDQTHWELGTAGIVEELDIPYSNLSVIEEKGREIETPATPLTISGEV